MRLLILLSMIFLSNSISATSLLDCRKLINNEVRVACYDAIVDSLFIKVETDPPKPIDVEASENTNSLPTSTELFGRSTTESKQIVEKTLAIEQITELKSRIISANKNAHKKLTISLENGQVWQQIDSVRLPLRKGDMVIIRTAALGSFLLEKETGSGAIRVNRLK